MIGRIAALTLPLALLVNAAAADDAALFETCRACHSLDPAAKVMAGPNLAGLIGRKVAGDPNFDYSPVLRQARDAGRVWTPETLDTFLADPEGMFPAMWMSALPLANPADRRALVRFLSDPNSR